MKIEVMVIPETSETIECHSWTLGSSLKFLDKEEKTIAVFTQFLYMKEIIE